MNKEFVVEMEDISKNFEGVHALSHMHFHLKKGEIHALIGENGAGKSTLMKILSGANSSDFGTVKIEGEVVEITSPKSSMALGISIIYQEFMLAPHLTVAENIYIDRLSEKGIFINWKKLRKEASQLLLSLGFEDISPNAIVGDLPIAHQQIVEICKSLSRDAKVLVLDEPTAVLTFNEIKKLFKLLRDLRNKGMGIVYISHRLEELFELCDNITVMRDGCYIGEYKCSEIDKNGLIERMVGRKLQTLFPKRTAKIGEEILDVRHLSAGKMVKDISFSIRKGEVVGFGGLVGAGRTETMRAIFGIDKIISGTVIYKGKEIKCKSPLEAVRNKIGLLPEDRKQQGVILELPIGLNVTLAIIKKITTHGIISNKSDRAIGQDILAKVGAKYDKITNNVSSLSGGNQQKVALSKWLAADCELMILDEPTRGVDVAAKTEIYKNINDLAEAGIAIIMISSEMEEIIHMSDRAIIMRQGKISGELLKEELTDINIMTLCVEG